MNNSNINSLDQIPQNQLPNLKGKKILIVDDDELNYMVIKLQISKTQAEIFYAPNGKIATEIADIQSLDLIFLDIRMPIMDGFEATKLIKSKNPTLPIIAQTAFTFSEDKQKCLKSGFDDYLSKPIETRELIRILNLIFF